MIILTVGDRNEKKKQEYLILYSSSAAITKANHITHNSYISGKGGRSCHSFNQLEISNFDFNSTGIVP